MLNQQGFTLIELVMSMVLISILSATMLPRFFNLGTYQEKVLFDDTLNAIRYAQKLAVATGCNVQLVIASNQFSLKRPSARSKCSSKTSADFTLSVVQPGAGVVYTGSQPGVTLTATTLYFDALGTASVSASINVGSSHSIAVVASTGFVYDSSP